MHGNIKHGHAGSCGSGASPTYRIWGGMKRRCKEKDPGMRSWKWYGGKGIRVCERWLDFQNFLADMGERPKGYWIERINGDGDYEPGNCRWATPLEQMQNVKLRERRMSVEEARKRLRARKQAWRKRKLVTDPEWAARYRVRKRAQIARYRARKAGGCTVVQELAGMELRGA